MGKINYSTAEIQDILDDSLALTNSVPPRITHTRVTSSTVSLTTLTELQNWLSTVVSGMANYGVRFVSFTTGAIFAPFRAATYEAMVMRGGDANTANVIFFNISGSNSSTYPTVLYMRRISGTWGAPATIAV